VDLPAVIFREYDIRGTVGDQLTEDLARTLGRALVTLGRVPMFFYLLHFPLLVQSARFLGVESKRGLGTAYLGAAAVVAVL